MGIKVTSETDTVIKKVIPYLTRRGYEVETDLDFEVPAKRAERLSLGYVDLLVTCGRPKPIFLIEAKRASKKLNLKDRDQALSYGVAHKVPFVVVTNGNDIQCFNCASGLPIQWDGSTAQKIPTKEQLLKSVLGALKKDKTTTKIPLGTDKSMPFRPGLSPKQLKALFYRCHSDIRRIERSEDRAFQDFSKILFLKLYEEKCDIENLAYPYSFSFHELAAKPDNESDQVMIAIKSMIKTLVETKNYGDVLSEPISLKQPKTYQQIVERLAEVSFYDSSFDSKGAAFEYYVRATLTGKKLGQYFTPRPVIHLMSTLIGREKATNAALMGNPMRVVDPACGTGGFLVYLMKQAMEELDQRESKNKITKSTYRAAAKNLREHTFFGADANGSVASAAKMNMIIAGDGHSNIFAEDTLATISKLWSPSLANCDLVITNPPFGTSESDSLTSADYEQYPVSTKKGQLLFLQKMVLCAKPDGGEICTVIDDGVLNTDTGAAIRRWLLKNCKLLSVVKLPEVTFKPNKINVRSSVLHLARRTQPDEDFSESYAVRFLDLRSLGYAGSGEALRGFDEAKLMGEIESFLRGNENFADYAYWRSFAVKVEDIIGDKTCRFDLKYWDPAVMKSMVTLYQTGAPSLTALVTTPIVRGVSPPQEAYVDRRDGYALVIKAGTNISKFGEIILEGDYIEKNVFEEFEKAALRKGDVLLSSTGTGTLGKAAVFREDTPAIADGHVSIIRVDQSKVYPEFLCDYLRHGFGSSQVRRLYTGSTGMIEITPDQVKSIIVELPSLEKQEEISQELRHIETKYRQAVNEANHEFAQKLQTFFEAPPPDEGGFASAADERIESDVPAPE
jgi:type I restriction enzyme M protein